MSDTLEGSMMRAMRENVMGRRRFEAAKAAMQGLLADPTDHEELRLYRVLDGETPGERIKEFTETCAQAVARIAVAHADALLKELEKKS